MKKIFTLLFAAFVLSANLWAAVDYSLENGVLTISGTGAMAEYSQGTAPWYADRASITEIVVGDNVTIIGSYAFYECSNVTSITIGSAVGNLKPASFRGCTGLTTITIPASVTQIGARAFQACTGLTSITCLGSSPANMGADVFYGVPSIPVYVPYAGIEAYQAAAQWNAMQIFPDPNGCPAWGNCGLQGDNVTWSLDCNGLLIISGTGAMENYTKDDHAPWYIHASSIKAIVIGEGVTTIGDFTFKDCVSATSLTIANSVVSIGKNAFAQCRNLTEVTIPGAVTNIGQYAFSGCYRITTLSILSSTIASLPAAVFGSCDGLQSILCAATTPPTCHAETFKDIDITEINQIKLYVPGNSKSLYQNALIWQDFDVQASAKKRILFVDEEGNELKVASVDEGAVPNADELTPTKADDEDYTYEFAGWLPAIQPATQDYVYVTHFVRTPKKFFNVGIGGANCALNVTNKVPEGTYLEVTVAPEDCYQFTQWSDGDNNNPRIIQVTEDTNISADCTKIIYTIEGQAQGSGAVTIAPKQ